MANLPPVPSSSPPNSPPVRADETAAKVPAAGTGEGFPQLLAQAPDARSAAADAGTSPPAGAAPDLPSATADGKDLPPDAAESPPSADAGEVVVVPVALPPGLIWSPPAPRELVAADGAAVAAAAAAPGQPVGPVAGDPGLAAVAPPSAFPGAPLPLPSAPASSAAMVPAAAPAGLTAPPAEALVGGEAGGPPLPSGAESLLDKAVAGLDALELGAVARPLPSSATAAAATQAPPTASPALHLPVGHADWDRELGARVLWVVRDQLQHAELRLHPAHLGPLEVRLAVQPDQGVSVQFLSAHAAVRDAVEAALPRLRELFAEGGLTLADANVGARSGSGSGQGGERQPAAARERPPVAAIAEVAAGATAPAAGLVDFFV